jgi:sec-independent protein translocase protein TatB
MFDIGWQELVLTAVIAIVVIGPKDLPRAMLTVARWVRKARVLARDFQRNVDDMIREAELDEVKKTVEAADIKSIESKFAETVDPTGDIRKDLDTHSIQADLDAAGRAPAEAPPTPAAAPADSAKTAG